MGWRVIVFVATLLVLSALESAIRLPGFLALAIACAIYLALFMPILGRRPPR